MNPYEAPHASGELPTPATENRCAICGLACSALGLTGLFVGGVLVQALPASGPYLWLACVVLPPVGVVLSGVAHLWPARRRAAMWGLFLGVVGLLYVPTLLLPAVR